MGNYFNPPLFVCSMGRKLESYTQYENLRSQLKENEVLVGLYDRGLFFNAPLLETEQEFQAFEVQYLRGELISRDFFAVDIEDWNKYGSYPIRRDNVRI